MALDEPNDNDETFSVNGFTFVMEKDLKKSAGRIAIDISYMGFVVSSENSVGAGSGKGSCSSCSTSSCG